ncbi:polysaccharide deacetylase family protein [Paenibacillus hodogayensis]|uniref:Polysaccharide deacetylase family protein n=1 Tax=Paenibacillus hodogayensis TaxID=279208 RepID=A0ABV5W2J2_9BACL
MKKKRNQWFFVGGTFALVTWGLLSSSHMDAFIRSLDGRSGTAYRVVQPVPDNFGASAPATMTNMPNAEQLRSSIEEEAQKRREAPIDAKLDRVWKAIPGYNGLEIDVEATWKRAHQEGIEKGIPYVYKEIPPQVRLEDLGAQPIYKGNPQKRMASLMINVAWGNEFIGPMLDILEKEQVRATFFFDGSWLSKNIDTAKTIQAKGHEMSNHAYTHKNMSKLGREDNRKEIEQTQKLLKEQLGVDNVLFAPPSGDFSDLTVKVAHELNLKTILWTLDTVDWMKPTSDSIVRKIAARVEPGSLILMHPTASSSGALQGMIRTIKQKGLALGTVSELISSDRVPKVEPD